MKTRLTTIALACAIATTLLLTACGGGSNGIDENGQCRVDFKLVPKEQCK